MLDYSHHHLASHSEVLNLPPISCTTLAIVFTVIVCLTFFFSFLRRRGEEEQERRDIKNREDQYDEEHTNRMRQKNWEADHLTPSMDKHWRISYQAITCPKFSKSIISFLEELRMLPPSLKEHKYQKFYKLRCVLAGSWLKQGGKMRHLPKADAGLIAINEALEYRDLRDVRGDIGRITKENFEDSTTKLSKRLRELSRSDDNFPLIWEQPIK
jgi:hypothetical protein